MGTRRKVVSAAPLRSALVRAIAVNLALGSPGLVTAQAAFPPAASIQRLLKDRVAQRRGVGVVLATRGPDEETRVYRAGSAGRRGVPLDGDTLFEIGSITKTFTAALLANMVIRGELKLDEPVEKYLTDGMRVPGRSGRQITFLDLATHTPRHCRRCRRTFTRRKSPTPMLTTRWRCWGSSSPAIG